MIVVYTYYTRREGIVTQELETNTDRLFAWMEDNLDKAKELGIESVGRVEEAGSRTIGVSFTNGDYAFVTVEEG